MHLDALSVFATLKETPCALKRILFLACENRIKVVQQRNCCLTITSTQLRHLIAEAII